MFHSSGGGKEGEPSAKRRRLEEREGDREDAKRRREEVREGEELIEQFLSAVRSLPLEDMGEEEVRERVVALKEEVLKKNNPYIRAIVDERSSSY